MLASISPTPGAMEKRDMEQDTAGTPGMSAGHTPDALPAFDGAVAAIISGDAEAHNLWVLLSHESQRDGYALRPMPWEGPGQYQHIRYKNGRAGFVRLPDGRGLQAEVLQRRAAIAKATGGGA